MINRLSARTSICANHSVPNIENVQSFPLATQIHFQQDFAFVVFPPQGRKDLNSPNSHCCVGLKFTAYPTQELFRSTKRMHSPKPNGLGLVFWLVATVFLTVSLRKPVVSEAHIWRSRITKRMVERAGALGMELTKVHDPVPRTKLDGYTTTINEFIEKCGPGETDKHQFSEWLNQHIEPQDRERKFYTAELAYNLLHWLKGNKKFAETDTHHDVTPLVKLTENLMDIINKPERTFKSFIDRFFLDSESAECKSFLNYLEKNSIPTSAKKLLIDNKKFYKLTVLYMHYMEWIVSLMANGKDLSPAQLERGSTKQMISHLKEFKGEEKVRKGVRLLRDAEYMVQHDLWKLTPVDDANYDPGMHMNALEFLAFLARELDVVGNDFVSWLSRNHRRSPGRFDEKHKYKPDELFHNYFLWYQSHMMEKKGYMHIPYNGEDIIKVAHLFLEQNKEKLYEQNHLHAMIEKFLPNAVGKHEFETFARVDGHSHLELMTDNVWDQDNVIGEYIYWINGYASEDMYKEYEMARRLGKKQYESKREKQDSVEVEKTHDTKPGKKKIRSEIAHEIPKNNVRYKFHLGFKYLKRKLHLFWERFRAFLGIKRSP